MCGIIGFVGQNTPAARELLYNLLIESAYRGRHSLGIASYNGASVDTHIIKPDELDKDTLMWMTMGVPFLSIIAHTRYCTSDPDWPMPITVMGRTMVLNGVISQEPFDKWPVINANDHYATRNDAEIALRLVGQGLPDQVPGSYAYCLLEPNGMILGARSPDRPMWWHSFQWGTAESTVYAFTSTIDIAIRADKHGARRSSRELIEGIMVCLNTAKEVTRWAVTKANQQIKSNPVSPCKL